MRVLMGGHLILNVVIFMELRIALQVIEETSPGATVGCFSNLPYFRS